MLSFTKSTYRALSSICTASGQVFFGVAVAALVLPIEFGKLFVVILELLITGISWYLALLFAERGKL